MPKVINDSGADYGFYFGGKEFILQKGVNSVSESDYAELLVQPMFKLIVQNGKFKVELAQKVEVKPEVKKVVTK
jgi:hypothetical protein